MRKGIRTCCGELEGMLGDLGGRGVGTSGCQNDGIVLTLKAGSLGNFKVLLLLVKCLGSMPQ